MAETTEDPLSIKTSPRVQWDVGSGTNISGIPNDKYMNIYLNDDLKTEEKEKKVPVLLTV